MERRSFLAAVFAWLVGLVALVLPRRATVRALSGFTPPTRPADPALLRREAEGTYSQKHRIYRRGAGSVSEMLDDLYRHLCETGHSVLSCDDPERRLWGFHTFDAAPGVVDEKVVIWQCSVGSVGHFSNEVRAGKFPKCLGGSLLAERKDGSEIPGVPKSLKGEVLLECLKTSQGRLRLAMALEGAGRTRFEHGLGPLV